MIMALKALIQLISLTLKKLMHFPISMAQLVTALTDMNSLTDQLLFLQLILILKCATKFT